MEKIYKSPSPKDTESLGETLSKLLSPGDFLGLIGDLGAGKTALTKGIAKGLGIDDTITSPTFTIINEYHGSISLAHMDAYRIKNSEELQNIGFDDYLRDYIVVMEWANLVEEEMLPEEVLWIDFEILGNNLRRIKLVSHSEYFNKKLQELNI